MKSSSRAVMRWMALALAASSVACGGAPVDELGDDAVAVEESGEALSLPGICETLLVGSWRAPVVLGTSSYESIQPSVAVSTNGDAIAVWVDRVDSTYIRILANRYHRPPQALFASWQAQPDVVATLLVPASTTPSVPAVVLDDSGVATVIFGREWFVPFSYHTVHATRSSAAGTWTPLSLIGAGAPSLRTMIDAAADEDGNVIALFERRRPGTRDVMSARFDAMAGWQTAEVRDEDAGEPVIATTPGGVMTAAWVDNDLARVFASRFTPASGFDAPLQLNGANQFAYGPAVATNPNGEAVVVWRGSGTNVEVSRAPANGAFGASQVMMPGCEYASVGLDDSGNAIATCSDSTGPMSRRMSATAALSATFQLDTDGSIPEIGVASGGNAFATWWEGGHIRARRLLHRAATAQCPETWSWGPIATASGANASAFDDLAVWRSGQAVAVWQESSGSHAIVASVHR